MSEENDVSIEEFINGMSRFLVQMELANLNETNEFVNNSLNWSEIEEETVCCADNCETFGTLQLNNTAIILCKDCFEHREKILNTA